MGQAAVFYSDEGTALPDLTGWNTSDPFDISFWADGADEWLHTGATDQGWQLGADKSTQTINIEEQSTPVATTLQNQSITITGALSEDVTQTLALSLNATTATVAATSSAAGYDEVTLKDTPIHYAVAMVTTNAKGFGRIVYAPSWTQLNNVSASFRRADDKRMYEVGFSTVCKTSDIRVINFTASATT
ncbi:MAG: hypothetical protein ACRDQA_22905 [Nocardioidaceae bacterium]